MLKVAYNNIVISNLVIVIYNNIIIINTPVYTCIYKQTKIIIINNM